MQNEQMFKLRGVLTSIKMMIDFKVVPGNKHERFRTLGESWSSCDHVGFPDN